MVGTEFLKKIKKAMKLELVKVNNGVQTVRTFPEISGNGLKYFRGFVKRFNNRLVTPYSVSTYEFARLVK